MKGTVAAAKARLLLGEPHVETVFLLPAGAHSCQRMARRCASRFNYWGL